MAVQFSPTSDFPEIDLASKAFRARYFHLIDGERSWFITILKWSSRFYVLWERTAFPQPFLNVLSAFIYETGGNDTSGQNRRLSRTKPSRPPFRPRLTSCGGDLFASLHRPFAALHQRRVSIYSVSCDFLLITTGVVITRLSWAKNLKRKFIVYFALRLFIASIYIASRRRIQSTRQNFKLPETKNTWLEPLSRSTARTSNVFSSVKLLREFDERNMTRNRVLAFGENSIIGRWRDILSFLWFDERRANRVLEFRSLRSSFSSIGFHWLNYGI